MSLRLYRVSEDIHVSGNVGLLRIALPSVVTRCLTLLLNHLKSASDRNRNSFVLLLFPRRNSCQFLGKAAAGTTHLRTPFLRLALALLFSESGL